MQVVDHEGERGPHRHEALGAAANAAMRVLACSSAAGYHCHCVVKTDGLSAVMVTDLEYPARVAFTGLQALLDDFVAAQPEWRRVDTDGGADFPGTEATLKKYQNPREVDKIMRITSDLEETKEVLHQTIDAVLERGTKLEELVEKSDDLSAQSKMFYKQAKKTNKCCVIS